MKKYCHFSSLKVQPKHLLLYYPSCKPKDETASGLAGWGHWQCKEKGMKQPLFVIASIEIMQSGQTRLPAIGTLFYVVLFVGTGNHLKQLKKLHRCLKGKEEWLQYTVTYRKLNKRRHV